MAAFPDDARQNLVLYHADIPAIDVQSLQARIEINAQPFAGEDHTSIGVVELLQSVADRPGAVGEELFPAGIERFQIDRAIDLLDQIVLAGKIAVQPGLGDPPPARQIARTAAKALV